MNKQQLRRHTRTLRNQLSQQQQDSAGIALAERLLLLVKQRNAQRVSLFFSMDGEIDTRPTIDALWQAGVEVYLPVIHPFNHQQMLFIRYQPDTPLIRSRLGILEPQLDCRQVCPPTQLDILFTPLVAFDQQGHRLGMGGGYYDRTLAHHYRERRSRPQVIGLAHNCQQTQTVPIDPWDIPLAEIITPGKHFFTTLP